MTSIPSRLKQLSSFSVLALGLLASHASAQTVTPTVNCKDVSPNVVYVAGSSAIKPFLGVVQQLMSADPTPYTIVYQAQGSCTGVKAIFSTTASERLIFDIPAAGGKPANYAIYFKADGTSQECFLDPAGNAVQVGASDVFADTCGFTAPAGVTIADYLGPIQPMTFVVPSASSQRSISAEAAYLAFGTGGDQGRPAPWTDYHLYFVRNAASGTQQMLGKSINVPADKWWGINRGGSSQVANQLKEIIDPATAEKAIGILSTDIADPLRTNLRILAFQAMGQTCGYLPDSTPFSYDKANVRNGHYFVWGPEHFFAQTTNGLASPAAAALVTRFAAPRLDPPLVAAIAKRGLVPQCSMKVKRTSEVGPLSAYITDSPCSCFFEENANGSTECIACNIASDCPSSAPACSYGYCEAP